jgi:hypothetical protein
VTMRKRLSSSAAMLTQREIGDEAPPGNSVPC